ncbi:hypothetical protein DMENIID0001_049330 [Sergentomyia squamirostris]
MEAMKFSSQELPFVQDPSTGVPGNMQYVLRGGNAEDKATLAKRKSIRAILTHSQEDSPVNLSFLQQIEATQRDNLTDTQQHEQTEAANNLGSNFEEIVVDGEVDDETEIIPEEEFLAMQSSHATQEFEDGSLSTPEDDGSFISLKTYRHMKKDKPRSNARYTSKEELISDLQKFAKHLRIKAPYKPEIFFRGILPEYPADDPNFLNKTIDKFLKPKEKVETPSESQYSVRDDFLENTTSSFSDSQDTVIYVPSQTQEQLVISSEEEIFTPTPEEEV